MDSISSVQNKDITGDGKTLRKFFEPSQRKNAQPERVNSGSLVDTAIGVGESGEFLMGVRSQRAPMKNSISQRERCFYDRPIVDSGSVVSTCPVDCATSVPAEKLQYSMNLESVLGESLQHHGIKRNVLFTNRSGSSMKYQF